MMYRARNLSFSAVTGFLVAFGFTNTTSTSLGQEYPNSIIDHRINAGYDFQYSEDALHSTSIHSQREINDFNHINTVFPEIQIDSDSEKRREIVGMISKYNEEMSSENEWTEISSSVLSRTFDLITDRSLLCVPVVVPTFRGSIQCEYEISDDNYFEVEIFPENYIVFLIDEGIESSEEFSDLSVVISKMNEFSKKQANHSQ